MRLKRRTLVVFLVIVIAFLFIAGWLIFTGAGREVVIAQAVAYAERVLQAEIVYDETQVSSASVSFTGFKLSQTATTQAAKVKIHYDLLGRKVQRIEAQDLTASFEDYIVAAKDVDVAMQHDGKTVDSIAIEGLQLKEPFTFQADTVFIEAEGRLVADRQVHSVTMGSASLRYPLAKAEQEKRQHVNPTDYTADWFASLFSPLFTLPLPFDLLTASRLDAVLEREETLRLELPLRNIEVHAGQQRLQRLDWEMEEGQFEQEEIAGKVRLSGQLTPDQLALQRAYLRHPAVLLELDAHTLPFKAKVIQLPMTLRQVELEPLLALMKQNTSTNAVLEGTLKLAFTPQGLVVERSTLSAVSGDRLAINTPLEHAGQQALTMVNQLLTDFTFEALSLDLAYSPERSVVKLNLFGHNAKVYEGQDIDLNINLQGDIVPLILSNMQLLDVQQYVE